MPNTYTAVTQEKDGWWVGWIEEIPGVNCQEKTRAELLVSLREVLTEMLDINREEARTRAEPGYAEELITA